MARNPFVEKRPRQGSVSYRSYSRRAADYVSGSFKTDNGFMLKNISRSYDSDGQRPTNYAILNMKCSGSQNISSSFYLHGGMKTSTQAGRTFQGITAEHALSNPFGVFYPYESESYGSNTLHGIVSFPPELVSDLHNQLLEKIDNQSIDIGTLVAELSSTVTYVAAKGLLLGRFAASIATGNYSSTMNVLGISKRVFRRAVYTSRRNNLRNSNAELNSRFLELQFAIKPLISDISSVASLYNSPEKVLRKVRMRASTSKNLTLNDNTSQEIDNGNLLALRRLNATMRAVAVYSVSNPEVVARKALGLNNIPAAAYQAVPFSWLLDYVVDVGGFLQNLSATDGLSFIHGFTSIKAKEVRTIKYTLNDTYDPGYSNKRETANVKIEGYGRQAGGTWPRATISYPITDGLSNHQVAIVSALGAVLVGKKYGK